MIRKSQFVSSLTADHYFWCSGGVPCCFEGVLGYYGMFQGCSGVVPGCSGLLRGFSGNVPGCSGMFPVFRVLQTPVFLPFFPGVCKTRNTPEHPGTPRNTPGTPRNIPGTPLEHPGTARNNLGTPLEHPIIPRNSLETARNTPGTPKIVVSGQTAHELTKQKISEDSQFFIRLLRITLRFPSIS